MATGTDYAYYTNLWQKAYYLEILNSSGIVVQSFAFSMPPQSSKIKIGQRINEKRTFGGLFTDDYGIDTAQISLSGNTGNSQLKEIKFNDVAQFVNGETEAQIILNDIAQYKNTYPTDFANYKLYLYDLSQSTVTGVASKYSGWEVNLKDVTISRDASRPLFWDYSIEFTGIRPLGIKSYKTNGLYGSTAIELLESLVTAVQTGLAALKKLLASYTSIVSTIVYAESLCNELVSSVTEYANTLEGFITTTDTGINSTFQIIEFPMSLATELVDAVQDIRTSFENTVDTIENDLTDVETKADTTAEIYTDLFNVEDNTYGVRATAKKLGNTPTVETVPSDTAGAVSATVTSSNTTTSGTTDTELSLLKTYGYKSETATSETTLDKLAVKYYGNADYANTIAIYNNIKGDSDIVTGMELKIPYLSYSQPINNNETYSAAGTDFYGTDISLSDNNDIELAEYGDYKTVGSENNVGQAMNLRLAEDKSSRVRLDNYGITSAAGTVDSASLLVFIASVKDTLVQDPRINSIENFSTKIDGSMVYMSYTANLENGGTYNFISSVSS
jgi:hypothetical protein